MSTRGSIAMDTAYEAYPLPATIRQERPRQPPEAVREPGHSECVGLDSEHEHRREGAGDRGSGAVVAPPGPDEPGEQREAPGDEHERSGEPGLHAQLGVVRLARLQRHVEALSGRPGVAEPVPLGMLHDRLDPVSQAVEMAADRRLAEADRRIEPAPGRQRAFYLRLSLLVRQVGREPVRPRSDRVEDRRESEAGGHDDQPPRGAATSAAEQREDDEPDGERDDRRAGERPQEARRADESERRAEPQAARNREQQQRHDEHVRGRERRDERRDEPAEEAVARVEREVLRQAGRAVVVVAELVVEVPDGARMAPPLDRHRVDLDQSPRRDRRSRSRDRPAQRAHRGHDRATEEVRSDEDEVVTQPVQDCLRPGVPAERTLGDHGVQDDERRERKREVVDEAWAERQPPGMRARAPRPTAAPPRAGSPSTPGSRRERRRVRRRRTAAT